MFISIRDAQGEIVKTVDTEDEAKKIIKDNKGWTYRVVGKIWP